MVTFAAFDLVGWSTVALALVTACSVVLGYRALRQTQEEIALSREEVAQAHRPVLIPRNDPGKVGPTTAEVQVAEDFVMVPAKNIGSGPALNIQCVLMLLGNDGRPTQASGTRQWTANHPGCAAGTTAILSVKIDHLAGLPCFRLELRYEDVAAKSWVTRADFLTAEAAGDTSRYSEVEVLST